MKKISIYLLFLFIVSSCSNTSKRHEPDSIVTLSFRNGFEKDIVLTVRNKTTDFSITLKKDSIFEIVSLADSCRLPNETLNAKYDFLSYQIKDSIQKVLIDRNGKKFLSITDLYPIKGMLTVFNSGSEKEIRLFEGEYLLK